MTDEALGCLLAIIVLAIILGPFVLTWSLNAVFGLGLVMSFKTWIAWVVLMLFALIFK